MVAAHILTKPSAPGNTVGVPFMVPIDGDANEPDLRRGDGVIVVPVPRFYSGEGYYAFDVRSLFGPQLMGGTAIYCASATCEPGHVRLWHTNKLYGTWKTPLVITRAEFDRAVLGKVAAHVRITDPRLMPRIL